MKNNRTDIGGATWHYHASPLFDFGTGRVDEALPLMTISFDGHLQDASHKRKRR